MAYTPPRYNEVNFSLSTYTPPQHDAVNFDLYYSETEGVNVDSVLAGIPVIPSVHVSMKYVIVLPTDIAAGSPVLPIITATNPAGKPVSVVAGEPVIPLVTADSNAGKLNSILTGQPVVPSVAASSPYGIASPEDFIAGTPVIGDLNARSIVAFPEDILSGIPSIPLVTASVPAVPVDSILTGAPVIPSITAQYVSALTNDILTGEPIVPTLTAYFVSGFVDDLLTGTPIIGNLTVTQPYAVASPEDVVSGVPDIGNALAYKNAYSYAAKSVIFDFADCWSTDPADRMGIRSIEFYYRGELLELQETVDFTTYAYFYDGGSYSTYRAFATYLEKDGAARYTSWRVYAGYITDQRIIIVFNDNDVKFDQIVVNNYHNSGVDTDFGVKNTKIYTSPNLITNTTYDDDTEQYRLIFDGEIPQHVALNQVDDKELFLVQPTMDVTTGIPVIGTPLALKTILVDDIITGQPVVDSVSAFTMAGISDMITGLPIVPTVNVEYIPLITQNSVLRYFLTLTGSTDIELPLKSFQSRLRSGSNTYLQVVIPGTEYALEISERSEGQIVIEAAYSTMGVVRRRSEIVRANLSNIRIDTGPTSKSITLTGYRQETYTAKETELTGPTYKNLNDGKLTYRFAEPKLDLNPGDTVIVDDDEFVADTISYIVSVSEGLTETRMEISEA